MYIYRQSQTLFSVHKKKISNKIMDCLQKSLWLISHRRKFMDPVVANIVFRGKGKKRKEPEMSSKRSFKELVEQFSIDVKEERIDEEDGNSYSFQDFYEYYDDPVTKWLNSRIGSILCCICNNKKEDFWVGCSSCDRWAHASCAGFSTMKQAKKKDYVCPICNSPKHGKDSGSSGSAASSSNAPIPGPSNPGPSIPDASHSNSSAPEEEDLEYDGSFFARSFPDTSITGEKPDDCAIFDKEECQNRAHWCAYDPINDLCTNVRFSEWSDSNLYGTQDFQEINRKRADVGIKEPIKVPPMKIFEAGDIPWNEEYDTSQIADALNKNKPVLCNITGIPANLIERFVTKEIKTPVWRQNWLVADNLEPAGAPQLLSVNESIHPSGKEIWDGMRVSLQAIDDTLTGVTVVGNAVRRNKFWHIPDPHWHAPPVVNLHLYGSCFKEYYFVDWNTMLQHDLGVNGRASQLEMKKVLNTGNYYYAKIGTGQKYNCVIWPSRMLHFIETQVHPNFTPIATERRQKALYLGFGTYIVLKNNLQLALEGIEDSQNYEEWTKQLDDDTRQSIIERLNSYVK